MNQLHPTIREIKEKAVLAVVRLPDSEDANLVTEALLKGGVSGIEITLSTPNTFEVIKKISSEFGADALVGIGSVTSIEHAEQAIQAGAKYVVCPVFKPEIVDFTRKKGIPTIPGCFTPTEIQTAFEAGAEVIKVFPADSLGMSFFKGVLAPLPHLNLIPTGGVSLTNAGQWLNHGAFAVGIGSALMDKAAIREKKFSKLTQNAKILMESIHNR
ncbi:MAG: bifunctional 4-hydroxy-2-oxoglutarate aldolase/2-dehydro-3-deoxy-phosphogluconate aldolase [Balneolales bacterium]|nr:bifunctional 4-hydroxy-2-oxoglutarate aldolase/2-dehydro-3-deoxy-phosphogluconate aldolase [Balneolales bacterium]